VKRIVDFSEAHSLPLRRNEELADWDRQTYKEAQDDGDENVISEENTLTIKRFKRNLQQN
jgi:hypothetical protein